MSEDKQTVLTRLSDCASVVAPLFSVLLIIFSAFTAAAESFSGYVKNDYGLNQSDVFVSFFAPGTDSLLFSDTTDSMGMVFIDNFVSRQYQIHISSAIFPDQWFSYHGNTLYPQYSIWLSASMDLNVTTSPIDNPLTSLVKVSVLDDAGSPLKNTNTGVSLISQNDNALIKRINLSDTNVVLFSDLPPSYYSVFIDSGLYPPQYFNSVCNSVEPDYINVLKNDTHDIKVYLTNQPRSNGHIVGVCQTENGLPAENVTVALYKSHDISTPIYTRNTTSNGRFWFDYIMYGEYYLKISANGYPDQWFSKNRSETVSSPEAFVWAMSTPQDTAFILLTANPIDNSPNAVIKIVILDSLSNRFDGLATVELIERNLNKSIYLGFDSSSDLYSGTNIGAGNYSLLINANGYKPQYYSPEGNTEYDVYRVPINLGDTLPFEIHLRNDLKYQETAINGYITGTVSGKNGRIGNTEIKIHNDTGVILQFYTDSTGSFPVQSLRSSNYYMTIGSTSYPFLYWSQNGLILDKSSHNYFYVPNGATVNFTIELLNDSSEQTGNYFAISGYVLDSLTKDPIAKCRVLLLQPEYSSYGFNSQALWSIFTALSNDSGKYAFTGIPSGEYIIAAEADTLNYVAQFYPGVYLTSAATPIVVSATSSITNVNFYLQKGGTFKGSTKDNAGNPLSGVTVYVQQSIQNSRFFQTVSGTDGGFEIRGIPAGIWNIYTEHSKYLKLESGGSEYVISKGNVTPVNTDVFEPGGFLSGSLNYIQDDITFFENKKSGTFYLFNYADTADQITIRPSYNINTSIIHSRNDNAGAFMSTVCKTGTWGVMFTPEPISRYETVSDTASLIPGFGWSFAGDIRTNGGNVYSVSPLDTVKGISFEMKRGYSLFGKVSYNNIPVNGNFNVSAYVKAMGRYMQVSSAHVISSGGFELPGLIPGEAYYVQVWAEGFQSQFWSPQGNTINPDKPYVLDTLLSVPLNVSLMDRLENGNGEYNNPLTLWKEKDADGNNILKWTVNEMYGIDTFVVYSCNRNYDATLLATLQARSGALTYSFQDNRILEGVTQYVIAGKGKEFTIRSNILTFYPNNTSSAYDTWVDAYGKRDQIVIEWGSGDSIRYSETDSVTLFRKIDNGNWISLAKRSAYERKMIDCQWSRSDSGKTFGYKIELRSGTIKSGIKYIKIDNAILSQLSDRILVGAYEKFKTIQQAIDYATDFDLIYVQSGTYKEKLNFKGKCLSVNGEWEYGKPPVLDASGDTAIVIPFNRNYSGRESSRVVGMKIQNAKVGVGASSNVQIQKCLFVNVSQAIVATIDSSKLNRAIMQNPFIPNSFETNAYQCTFIAKSSGDIVGAVIPAGVTEVDNNTTDYYDEGQYLIKPLLSCYANVNIEKSILFQFFSRSAQSTVPVKYSGKSAYVTLRNCNFWETSVQVPLSQVYLENIDHQDPQFIDTLTYFLPNSSALRSTGIGYDSQWFNEYSDRPSAIKNLEIRTLSMNSIGLRWDPSPVTEKVVAYKIYRIPGDTGFFHINEASEWDLRISSDSIESSFPVFTTNRSYFIDTSIISGMPYIYAVAAIDSNSSEGIIKLSAPPNITEYMVNSYSYSYKLSAQKWYMLSPWGDKAIQIPKYSNAFHWDDKGTGNSLLSQYFESVQLLPGKGYWCKTLTDTVLTITSASLSGLKQIQDTLKCKLEKGITGWNQIASPFPFPVIPSWISTLAVWEWNPDSLGYSRAKSLKPWHAYWVNVEQDTSLLLLDKKWPPAPIMMLAKRLQGINWELNLSLRGRSAWDPENKIGVTTASLFKSETFQSPEPPLAFGASQLFFLKSSTPGSEITENNQRFANLYKDASEKTQQWLVGITPSEHKSTIQVQEIADLPKGLFAVWVSGKEVQDLTVSNEISIEPHDNTKYGYIIVTSDIRQISLYRKSFHLRSPYPNPFRGSTRIEYFLPYQFMENGMMLSGGGVHINLSVYNIAGQKIKTLVNGTVGAGIHSAVWNGTDNNIQKVSAGFYIVRLKSQSFNKTVKIFRMR